MGKESWDTKGTISHLENLKEMKDFDRLFTRNKTQSQYGLQPQEQNRTPANQKCRYCGSTYPPRQCPAYDKMCAASWEINHYKGVCRCGRNKRVHNIDPQVEWHQDKDNLDKVNINSTYIDSFSLNSKWSVITVHLNTSSRQATLAVSYKIDSGSVGT